MDFAFLAFIWHFQDKICNFPTLFVKNWLIFGSTCRLKDCFGAPKIERFECILRKNQGLALENAKFSEIWHYCLESLAALIWQPFFFPGLPRRHELDGGRRSLAAPLHLRRPQVHPPAARAFKAARRLLRNLLGHLAARGSILRAERPRRAKGEFSPLGRGA